MLLVKTFLTLSKKADKKSLCDLIVRWNQESPYEEKRIGGLKWQYQNGERMGTDESYMTFIKGPLDDSFSCRYVNLDDGIRWTTEITAYIQRKALLVTLSSEVAKVGAGMDKIHSYSSPYILKMLCDNGLLADDSGIEMSSRMLYDTDFIEPLSDIINGKTDHGLPIVYVSGCGGGQYPVDAGKLASLLAGRAHVIVQENLRSQRAIMDRTEKGLIPLDGAVAVYIPGEAKAPRFFSNRTLDDKGRKKLWDSITAPVYRYGRTLPEQEEYTFVGLEKAKLKSALELKEDKHATIRELFQETASTSSELTAQLQFVKEKLKETETQLEEAKAAEQRVKKEFLNVQKEEAEILRKEITEELSRDYEKRIESMQKEHEAEIEKICKESGGKRGKTAVDGLTEPSENDQKLKEAEELMAMLDKEQKEQKEQKKLIETLKAENEKLKNMNGKSEKQDGALLLYGTEKDVYPGEIKDFIIGAIEKAIEESVPGSRRDDVLTDISDSNGGYKDLAKEKKEAVGRILKGSRAIGPQQITDLENEGFTVEKDKRHYRLSWGGDKRYLITLAAAPSDSGAYEHAKGEIGRLIF